MMRIRISRVIGSAAKAKARCPSPLPELKMLLFGSPPMGVDGEPVLPSLTAFPDHLNSKAIYYLPPTLVLLTTSEGDPDFFLLRYHGDFTQTKGGWLRFRLGFSTI